jgi:hypothetical protein
LDEDQVNVAVTRGLIPGEGTKKDRLSDFMFSEDRFQPFLQVIHLHDLIPENIIACASAAMHFAGQLTPTSFRAAISWNKTQ